MSLRNTNIWPPHGFFLLLDIQLDCFLATFMISWSKMTDFCPRECGQKWRFGQWALKTSNTCLTYFFSCSQLNKDFKESRGSWKHNMEKTRVHKWAPRNAALKPIWPGVPALDFICLNNWTLVLGIAVINCSVNTLGYSLFYWQKLRFRPWMWLSGKVCFTWAKPWVLYAAWGGVWGGGYPSSTCPLNM